MIFKTDYIQRQISPPVLQHTGTKLGTSHIWYRWKGNFMENHHKVAPLIPAWGKMLQTKIR